MTIYTTEEARLKLRISRSRFYKLLREGKIKALRNGRRYLIPESSIQAFIETELAVQKNKEGE